MGSRRLWGSRVSKYTEIVLHSLWITPGACCKKKFGGGRGQGTFLGQLNGGPKKLFKPKKDPKTHSLGAKGASVPVDPLDAPWRYLVQVWDWNDKDGDDESCHNQYLEEPEPVVDGGPNPLAWGHPDCDEAHGQEEKPDGEWNLKQTSPVSVSVSVSVSKNSKHFIKVELSFPNLFRKSSEVE